MRAPLASAGAAERGLDWSSRIRTGAFRLLARILGGRIPRPLDCSSVHRILVLQLQQLGDSIVFTPTLRAIRERFPDAQIDMLCSPVSYELYRKCPYIRRAFGAAWRGPSARRLLSLLRVLLPIRREHYDLAIADATEVAALYGITAAFTGAPARIGFDDAYRGTFYTHRLQRPSGIDFVSCNLEIARLLGARTDSAQVEAYYDDDDLRHARELLARVGPERAFIAIHPASNWQSKTWFPERWANLADQLAQRYEGHIIFVGASADGAYVSEIARLMQSPAISLAGETTLPQLAALLSISDLFVGTDSGPRHVAAGAGANRVILMSSQDLPERWDFHQPMEIILRTDPACSPCFQSYCSHRTCMGQISESMVMEACATLLSHAVTEPGITESRANQRGMFTGKLAARSS
ncbi:MAG TPA: glycosyltransferase family 9 protein [Acidobacteriaceae bacterium]|nr:glycosyltransferase family 9 protein [Acidobacteriaceae bacterium]